MFFNRSKMLFSTTLALRHASWAQTCCSTFKYPFLDCVIPGNQNTFRVKTQRNFSVSKAVLKVSKRKPKGISSLMEKYVKGQSKKTTTKTFEVWDTINCVDLAKVLDVEADDVFELVLNINYNLLKDERQPIRDRNVLNEIAKKLRCKFKLIPDPRKHKGQHDRNESEEENLDVVHPPPRLEDLVPRPPVCAIVGHIDHGKTTLLDHLRKSSIVSLEHGGITQHIGAFSVALPTADGTSTQNITFLDTPGHAAFKNMRIRGAHITDIVILVVDAVEGPLEQTLESIRAVKDARVSMIVAINKIDKPRADIERCKKALYDAGVNLEDYGGDVQAVPISALCGTNLTNLIESILAQAEVLQLSADPNGPVEATVIEAEVEPGIGKTAVVLVRRGIVRKGDFLVCGHAYAKVKMLLNTGAILEDEKALRKELTEVRPSEACKIVGWKDLPHAGGEVLQVESEKRAHQVIQWRKHQEVKLKQAEELRLIEHRREADRKKYEEYRLKKLQTGMIHLNYGRYDFHVREKQSPNDEGPPKVSFVIKTDVDGSLEAIVGCLQTYKSSEVNMDILHVGVGAVTESDLKLAQEFGGIVYSFNASFPDGVRRSASFLKVPVKEFNVIYALIDDLKQELSQKLPPEDVEIQVGRGYVQKEFLISEKNKKISVAGCRVNHGKFDKSKRFKVLRAGGSQVVFEGQIASLRHLKDEVAHVSHGQECGVRLQNFGDRFLERDEIICYEMSKEPRFTDWSPGF